MASINEKDRKKAAKAQKFAEKKAKSNTVSAPSKNADKKAQQLAKASSLDTQTSSATYVQNTPPGSKKTLDHFPSAYDPKYVESGWYTWWEKEGFFKPEFDAGKVKKEGYFAIPEPPPNVTGSLHMGHALGNALQDALIRWNRMRGKTTLWLPGCDHAGIATQTVVENMLRRRENKTRHDLGREKLIERIWEWKGEFHEKINSALRRMGGSFDWTREAFTMDENLSAAVTETFVRLHEEGIIYRENRLVNWCVQLNTAISNLEVVNKELEGKTKLTVPGYDKKIEFGVIVHFKYEIEGSDERIEVATTRPETMLGDSGIAVHPKDERYMHLVGKKAKHPFLDRLLPIFTDDYVDPEFGTGAVKITPAHDPNDFAIGRRHGLQFINILNDNGTMNNNTGEFEGLKRFDARYKVIESLKAKDLYVKTEDNKMTVPLCERSKDVIEPIMRPQWWMKMQDLADAAIKAVRDGEVIIRPKTAEDSYFRWLNNCQDWCLSRQLWWGHQAPVYLVKIDGRTVDGSDGEQWVSGRNREEAEEKAKVKFPGQNFTLERDPDVMDTWFSSGLWPFSTLGWPKKTHDFENLFPTSVLETGWDILFFWVARMIMLSIKLTGQVPFREVYCHSLVRDSEGRKMSKSLGNVINPLDVMEGIELENLHNQLKTGNLDPVEVEKAAKWQKSAFPKGIPECGADALRFSLASYTTGGGDIHFDVKVIHGFRRFCNKIYQATKYVLGKISPDFEPLPAPTGKTGHESLAERWILHKMTICAREIDRALEARRFSDATKIIYEYWYNQLCDVYIENSKAIIQSGTDAERLSATQTLYTVLEGALTMISPFMPFLTEELWQRLPRRPSDTTPSIALATYPQYDPSMDDPQSEEAYDLILAITKGIRSLCAEYSIKDSADLTIHLTTATAHDTCAAQLPSLRALSGKAVSESSVISILSPKEQKPMGKLIVYAVSSEAAVYLHVKGDMDVEKEIEKAKSRVGKAREGVKEQNGVLEKMSGLETVGENVEEGQRRRLRDLEAEVGTYEGAVEGLEKLRLG